MDAAHTLPTCRTYGTCTPRIHTYMHTVHEKHMVRAYRPYTQACRAYCAYMPCIQHTCIPCIQHMHIYREYNTYSACMPPIDHIYTTRIQHMHTGIAHAALVHRAYILPMHIAHTCRAYSTYMPRIQHMHTANTARTVHACRAYSLYIPPKEHTHTAHLKTCWYRAYST